MEYTVCVFIHFSWIYILWMVCKIRKWEEERKNTVMWSTLNISFEKMETSHVQGRLDQYESNIIV